MTTLLGRTKTADTYLAGFGATGALVAGALVVFLILVGMVTFDAWPGGGIFGGGDDVTLSGDETPAATVAPVAAAVPGDDRPRAGGPSAERGDGGERGFGGGGGVGGGGGSGEGGSGGGTQGESGQSPVQSAGNAVDDVIRDTTNTVNQTSQNVQQTVNGAVGGATKTVNDVLKGPQP
jgi:hypothetical protein